MKCESTNFAKWDRYRVAYSYLFYTFIDPTRQIWHFAAYLCPVPEQHSTTLWSGAYKSCPRAEPGIPSQCQDFNLHPCGCWHNSPTAKLPRLWSFEYHDTVTSEQTIQPSEVCHGCCFLRDKTLAWIIDGMTFQRKQYYREYSLKHNITFGYFSGA